MSLDSKKAAGPDGLDPYFLKLLAPVLAQPVTDILNLSICTQAVPDMWKQVFVSPLLKAGDPTDLNNYHPISNLCVLAKILESLVADQMKKFIEQHNNLSPMQSGFRPKHSTVTACLKVVDDIKSTLEKKWFCVALFIDLLKAFDTVNHYILLKSLSIVGFGPSVMNWFLSYLSDRSQLVRLGDTVT